MTIKKTLLFSLLLFSGAAGAAIYGTNSAFDSRIQDAVYNKDDVINVRVKVGSVSVVQFDKGEKVLTVGLGDPSAWNVNLVGNKIFFRPSATDPDTNVIVVTDRKMYALYLKAVNRKPTFILRVRGKNKNNHSSRVEYPCSNGGLINGRYSVRGNSQIFPYQIWDDGEFTCMRWSGRQEMPIVYRVDIAGNESLTNVHMDNNTMVIHDVSNRYIVRLGESLVAEVKTESIVNKGWRSSRSSDGEVMNDKYER